MVLMCSQERIDYLHGEKPSTKVRKAEAVVMIDGVMVVRLANGRFMTSARDFHKWAYPISGNYAFREPLVRGFQAIGFITEEEANEHLAEHQQARERRERAHAYEMVSKYAEQLGMGDLAAQAIEAQRAETGTGSVHESAVSNADAPKE